MMMSRDSSARRSHSKQVFVEVCLLHAVLEMSASVEVGVILNVSVACFATSVQ